jgi:WD40 repeat protein
MFSVGNDNCLRLYDLELYVEIGETRLPSDINGSCSSGSFVSPSHILVGTTIGKLVLFEVKTLQVVHVMGGHSDIVSSIAPHPGSSDGSIKPGALALTCSNKDNTIRLWDLTKGRCSYVTKVAPAEGRAAGGGPSTIKFSPDGSNYTYVHSFTHVTTKTTLEGNILLDIDLESLPLRINDFCYVNAGFVSLGLQNGGIALMKLSEEKEEEVRWMR